MRLHNGGYLETARIDVTALFWISAVIDACAVVALLRAGARAGVPLLAVAATAKLALVAANGWDRFGVLHLVYLDLVVALPLVGVALLVTRRRGIAGTAVALALLVPAPFGAYATFVEPDDLELERTSVALSPARAGDGDVRVAVLADIQTDDVADYDRRAVRRAMELRPDVVLLPGDLFQMSSGRFRRELPELRALVRGLRAPGGVFVVPGDADDPRRLRAVVAGSSMRLLVNETVTTAVRGRRLTIAGIELSWRSPAARRTIRAVEGRPGAADVRILLAHRPDAVYELPPRSRTDLVVAGHTHGGQVKLPLVGPLITKSDVPRDAAGGGLSELDGRRLYVSRGVGVEHGGHAPRIRFMCRPELTLLTLRG